MFRMHLKDIDTEHGLEEHKHYLLFFFIMCQWSYRHKYCVVLNLHLFMKKNVNVTIIKYVIFVVEIMLRKFYTHKNYYSKISVNFY